MSLSDHEIETDAESSEHEHLRVPSRHDVSEVRRIVAESPDLPLPSRLAELGPDELQIRYERLGRSSAELADELGVAVEQVWVALATHGIAIRVGLGDLLSPAYLRRRYVLSGESTVAIAESIGCSQQSVGKYLQRYGIPIRHGDDPHLAVAELLAPPAPAPPQPGGHGANQPRQPKLTPAYLLKEYVRKGRSASSIAREWGLTSADVMRMVKDEGLPLHTVTPPPPPPPTVRAQELPRAFLEEHYVDKGMSARQIGELVGLSERAVNLRLHRVGIELRPAGGGRSVQDRLDPDELRRRYVEDGESITAIAESLSMSPESVRRALHRHGLITRQIDRASDVANRLTKEALEQAYVRDGLKLTEIAERFGVSAETVRRYAKLHGITLDRGRYGRRGGPLSEVLTKEVLEREYVDAKKSLAEIAEEYGFSAEGVRRHLHRVGIELRHGRTGGPRPQKAPKRPGRKSKLTKAVLLSRYVDQQQSIAEIADALHVSQEGVRQALRRNGIELRNQRPARVELDSDFLHERYVTQERTLHEIAEEVGVSTETVRREIHRLGIAIRRPPAPEELPREHLLEEYERKGRSAASIAEEHGVSEQTIRRWLKRHGIAVRPAGGGSRHPDLADTLTAVYFQREYVLAGRTLADIAREHDVSTETVRRYAKKHNIVTDRSDEAGIADILPETWLRQHYVEMEWSLAQMAENRGVSAETIRRYLRRYGIDLRPAGKRAADGDHQSAPPPSTPTRSLWGEPQDGDGSRGGGAGGGADGHDPGHPQDTDVTGSDGDGSAHRDDLSTDERAIRAFLTGR